MPGLQLGTVASDPGLVGLEVEVFPSQKRAWTQLFIDGARICGL